MKPLVWFLAVFLAILLTGCSSDNIPTISENDGQAQLAPASTEGQINSQILAEAARQINMPFSQSGSCKEWVQRLVLKATSNSKSIPQNDPCALYQWKPSSSVKIIWQVKFACVPSFSSNIKPGQIMQIQWRSNYMNGREHTIILNSISPSSISYYEANSPPGGPVRHTTTKLINWQAAAWTVYQVVP